MPILFNIARRRKEKGWNQADLAVRSTLTIQTISKIENGYENTTIKSLALIANAFGCSIRDLFEDPSGELAILLKNSKKED